MPALLRSVQVLLQGAMLTPGSRTVTGGLRLMGLATERHFTHYHRVLNRATWSARHYFVNSAAEPEFVQ